MRTKDKIRWKESDVSDVVRNEVKILGNDVRLSIIIDNDNAEKVKQMIKRHVK